MLNSDVIPICLNLEVPLWEIEVIAIGDTNTTNNPIAIMEYFKFFVISCLKNMNNAAKYIGTKIQVDL